MTVKRRHRIGAMVLAIAMAFSMVGSAILSYFYGGGLPAANPSAVSAPDPAREFADLKSSAQALTEAVKANPDNLELQTQLGNTYYDLGMMAFNLAPDEAKGYLEQAVTSYQTVLASKKDINITADLATAAFNAGNNDLAEKSFQAVLAENPDFYPALFNYGRFLFDAKKDYAGAVRVWQKASGVSSSDQDKQILQTLITAAQDQLEASLNGPAANGASSSSGSSNSPASGK